MEETPEQRIERLRGMRADVVFIDMETTDLKSDEGEILDIAVLIVDPDISIVKKEVYRVISYPQGVLDRVDPFLKQRITKSGLHEKVRDIHASDLKNTNDAILHALGDPRIDQHLPILAGSSNRIKLSMEFLQRYMPKICEKVSYINQIDVPSVRTFVKSLRPDDKYIVRKSVNSFERVHLLFEELKYYKYCYASPSQILPSDTNEQTKKRKR